MLFNYINSLNAAFCCTQSYDSETEENALRLYFLLLLRWLALVGQFISLLMAKHFNLISINQASLFFSTILFMLIFNFFSIKISKKESIFATQGFLFFQLAFDVLALVSLLTFSGGAWNPFSWFLLFHGGLGAFILRKNTRKYFFLFLIFSLILIHNNPYLQDASYLQLIFTEYLFSSQLIFLLFLIGFVSWITHILDLRKKSTISLIKNKHQMDQLKALGIIATGFCHEFSTPLNTVKIRLNRMKHKSELEKNTDLIIALEALTQCEKSIHSLLEKQINPEKSSFDKINMNSLLIKILKSYSKDTVDIKLRTTEDSLFTYAPKISLTQSILDIIDNSIISMEDSMNKLIKISIYKKNNEFLIMSFEDVGKGIPKFIIKNLGQPFFTTSPEGTGLGLYHAINLCRFIGGDLQIKEGLPIGTLVEFHLPLFKNNTGMIS
jgi:two-component system sensor histidine kinase RegB